MALDLERLTLSQPFHTQQQHFPVHAEYYGLNTPTEPHRLQKTDTRP